MPELKMPQLGESVVEGTITKWLKKEGDTVAEDELIVEISTDKVDSEVPSSLSGTLTKILVPEGETVAVGTPIAEIGGEGEAAQDSGGEEAQTEAPQAQAQAEQPQADQSQTQPQQTEDQQQPAEQAPAAQAESQQAAPSQPPPPPPPAPSQEQTRRTESTRPSPPAPPSGRPAGQPGDTSKRGIISPLVRRMADENDVNLDEVEGTGTGGRIRKQDVQRYIEQRKSGAAIRPAGSAEPAPQTEAAPAREEAGAREQAAAPTRAPGEREELVPWTNIRRRTAEHMVASHLETARAWNAVEADWTNIVRLREQAKDAFKKAEGFSLTYMPFLARVVCETLLEMPEVNATYEEESQANRIKRYVNLGIAVALEGGGLIVPVVKAADEKNLTGLARGIHDVATRARSKKLSPDDLMGGTFTITNPGPFGSIISVPIIPRGQTAILGFEAIQKRVVVTDNDSIAIRSMGFLSLSWDHRIIDGAEAAKFLARLRERIETTDFSGELSQFL
ncbi:MAG TPA: dihydrolipoamide acetyltransferase family protein [Actinomycetota bacterium]|nr:dihydrolipoamide acetyltransferase family protein [Actinomycetota bacterium]